jgi:hypothetical protein
MIDADRTLTAFTMARRKKLSVFPKSYCTISGVDQQQVKSAFNGEMPFENLILLTME